MKRNLLSFKIGTSVLALHRFRVLSTLLFCLCVGLSVSAQQHQAISGAVSDEYGPMVGVLVAVKGGGASAITDTNGKFTLFAAPENILIFRYVGYVTQEITVGNQTSIDVVLATDYLSLNDVVVVGYGVQKKSLVTGAISQIKSSDIEKTGIINAGDALAGKVSGVQVISDNGQPGAGVQVIIRGVGSNNANGNNPIYIVDGMAVDGISYLNVADIESMEVLKDAAASAIYGARGGNGVVIITTKKAKDGQAMINYSFSYGISNLPRKLPLLTANEYRIIRNEMSLNAGNAPQFGDEDLNSFQHGTDWQEAILYRNAPTTQHHVSFVGGSNKSSYSLALSYLDQNGLFARGKSNYKRYNATFNGEQKFLRDDVLKVGQNIVVSRVINNDITSNSILGGPITNALNMDPLTGIYDDYTQYEDYQNDPAFYDLFHGFAYSRFMNTDYSNPVALVHFANPNSYWTTAKANIYAELTFLKDFKLRGSVGGDMVWTQTFSYTQPRRFNLSTVFNTQNATSQSSAERQILNSDLYLTWNKVIKRKHEITAMAGTQMIQRSGLNISASRDGLLTTDIERAYVSLAKGGDPTAGGGLNDPSSLLSFFARANYAYDSRYLLTATIRRDGSSKFLGNNRYSTFPSVSVGWNATNEAFLRDVKYLDNLKLRASWGQNGNENIDTNSALSIISTSSQLGYVLDSNHSEAITPGSAPTKLANPDLKWETSEQFNIGLDVALFRNWTITADFYIKTTKDLLVTSPIPLFMGAGFPTVNAGNVRNTGFEFMVGYRNTFFRELVVNASANISFNKNMVTYVGTDSKFVSGMSISGINEVTRMEEGYPMAYFVGLETLGVFQNWDQVNNYTWTDPATGSTRLIQPNAQPGDLIFADRDGNGTIDTHDRTMIGNPYPKATYGINLNVSWRNIDLTVNTSGAAGHQIFSAVRRNQSPNNWGTWALGRWTGEGTSNSVPRLTDLDNNQNWTQSSSLYIQDGDYFRIRNVALGYTFNFAPQYYIQNLRVFVSVNNLYTFTKYNRGYDPEIGAQNPLNVGVDLGNYPRPRIMSMGLNLTF